MKRAPGGGPPEPFARSPWLGWDGGAQRVPRLGAQCKGRLVDIDQPKGSPSILDACATFIQVLLEPSIGTRPAPVRRGDRKALSRTHLADSLRNRYESDAVGRIRIVGGSYNVDPVHLRFSGASGVSAMTETSLRHLDIGAARNKYDAEAETEISTEAKLLVEEHSTDADIVAAQRADALFCDGKTIEGARWLEIFRRIAMSSGRDGRVLLLQ